MVTPFFVAPACWDLQAGIVTWGAATTITGDSDVSTNGTLFGAGNIADSDSLTINGVTFTGITFTNGETTVTSGNFEFSVSASVLLGVDGAF